MMTFSKAYEAWRTAVLPETSTDDDIDSAQKDLILIDSMLAGVAIPYAERSQAAEFEIDMESEIQSLRSDLGLLSAGATPPRSDILRGIVQYLDLLEAVYLSYQSETHIK